MDRINRNHSDDVIVDLTDPGIVSPGTDSSILSTGPGEVSPTAKIDPGIVSPVYNLPVNNNVPVVATATIQPQQSQQTEDRGIVSPFYSNGGHVKQKNGGLTRQESLDQDPNHIEVSLEEGSGDPADEVLTRATDFFVEHNDNYLVSWQDAAQMISDAGEDPAKPPIPGLNKEYIAWKLRRIVESIYFRLLTLILILIDIIFVIIDLAMAGRQRGLEAADMTISTYFVIEVIVRICLLKPKHFFIQIWNVVDFVVISVTFILSIVAIVGIEWAEGLTLFTALRFVRIIRLVRIYTEKKNLETAARQLISQNKRRFQQDGFDLDLTYVTNRVIATSFPSSGLWAMYRNPIDKVAHFLDTKHRDKYKVFNLCSERVYDTSHFHDRVERVLIDDHNVPSLEQMQEFVSNVKEWLGSDPENVIVVHCKGGKGRTGTMICIWLIESGVFTSASNSLDYFGHRRTDTNVSKKFQGVETPSQSRYVGYYEWMKNHGGQLPDKVGLRISEIVITGMMYLGAGNGSDFWVEVDQGRGNTVFTAVFGTHKNCSTEYNSMSDTLTVKLINCPVLKGDTRVLFQTSAVEVPKNYENCPFYFWFHTGFIQNHELALEREELDNPHKNKTWKFFRESFSVKLRFCD